MLFFRAKLEFCRGQLITALFISPWLILFFSSQANCQLIAKLKGHKTSVMDLQFSPDESKIAAAGSVGGYSGSQQGNKVTFTGAGEFKLWDLKTKKTIWSIDLNTTLDPGPNVTHAPPKGIPPRLLPKLRNYPFYPHVILSIDFSPDGKVIASGDDKGVIRFWNVKDGSVNQIKRNKVPTMFDPFIFMGLTSVNYLADGKSMVSTFMSDPYVTFWTLKSKKNPKKVKLKQTFTAVTQSPNRIRLAIESFASSKKDYITIWDLKRRKKIRTIKKPKMNFLERSFTSDGKNFVVFGNIGTYKNPKYVIRKWNIASGKSSKSINVKLPSRDIATKFNHGATKLAILTKDQKIVILDVATGKIATEIKLDHQPSLGTLQFSPSGKILASTHNPSHTIYLWKVPPQKSLSDKK